MHQGATDAESRAQAPGHPGAGPGGGPSDGQGGGQAGGLEGEHGAGTGESPAISRVVTEFLRGFAMALHRFATYPTGHPSLLPVAERMLLQLSRVLAERPALTLGVTTRQLLVDGATTPENHPVMSELAARLHGHQLGAMIFRRGVELEELASLLDVLSREPARGERPLGLLPLRDRPSWTHLQLLPVEYGALALSDHAGGGSLPVRELWIALFHSILRREAREEFGSDPATLDPAGDLPSGARLAELVHSWDEGSLGGDTRPERDLVEGLRELVRGLQWSGPADGSDLRMRTSEFLQAVDPEILSGMIERGTDADTRRALAMDASRAGLTTDAVLRVVEVTLAAEGRSLSPPLSRLLQKMARRGESSRPGLGRTEACSALRDQLHRIVAGGTDRSAAQGGATSGTPTGPEPGGMGDLPDDESLTAPAPFRVLELAFLLDEPGPALEVALRACIRAGDVGAVLDLAEGAASDSRTAARVEACIFSPDRLTDLLSGPDVDEGSMRRIVDALGDDAIEPLFERLIGSESRAVRRKIFDRLASLGPRITPIILHHLSSDLWYVQRNMLALLQRMPVLPTGFSPVQHMLSDEVRVRREALPLAFRDPGHRDEALVLALRDSDERVLRSGLLELQRGVPDPVVPVLVANVLEGSRLSHLRSLAARALGQSRAPAARDALVRVCTADRGLMDPRRRVAPSSPVVIAAMHALARGWTGDPEVAWVIEGGLHAEDPRLRAAARGVPAADDAGADAVTGGEGAS